MPSKVEIGDAHGAAGYAGQPVAWLTGGGCGDTVGKSIGYGYGRNPPGVDPAFLTAGTYQLEVASERVPCRPHRLAPASPHAGAKAARRVGLTALYDPKSERVRA